MSATETPDSGEGVVAAWISRHPRTVLAAILFVGFVVRGWGILSESMTHYDEYYYSGSGAWVAADAATAERVLAEAQRGGQVVGTPPARLAFLHPMLPLHAPLLYPTLVGVAFVGAGKTWYAAGAVVSVVLGTGTVWLVYLLARRFLVTSWALLAAALMACSDLHTVYSRMWLVDATFGFFFGLAMYVGVRFLQSGRMAWSLLFGVVVGLAWNAKYNGWMPPAILAVAGVLSLLLRRRPTQSPVPRARIAVGLAIGAAIAAAMFVPWKMYVERHFPGGYQQVRDHHAMFTDVPNAWAQAETLFGKPVAAVSKWAENSWRLVCEMPAYRQFGWLISLLIGGISLRWLRRDRASVLATICVTAAIVGLGGDLVLLTLAAWHGLGLLLRSDTTAAETTLVVWLGAFLLLVPYYYAYSRLLVPALPVATVLACHAWSRCTQAASVHPPLLRAAGLVTLTLLAMFAGRWHPADVGKLIELRSATAYRDMANFVADHVPENGILLNQTQPCFWFLLSRTARAPVDEAVDLSRFPGPTFIAADFTIHTRPQALAWLKATMPRLRVVKRVRQRLPAPAQFNVAVRPRDFWSKLRSVDNKAALEEIPPPLALGMFELVLYEVLPEATP